MSVDLLAQSEHLLSGMFLARAVYGGEYIDAAYDLGGDGDKAAQKADDYRGYIESQVVGSWQLLDDSDLTFNYRGGDAGFTSGGLYNARVHSGSTDTFDAQGLLAIENGNTLVLTFRGTDGEDPAVEDGQAFTGSGASAHYKGFKSLIDAAYDYADNHAEITDIVVSGHSLGGAMVDIFTLVDAARFRALRPDHLTIVSLASSGVPPDLPNFLNGIDKDVAVIKKIPLLDIEYIADLNRPADYISIANSEDRVRFAKDFPDIPEALGLIPIFTLKPNLHFGGDLVFDLPNIDNTDAEYSDTYPGFIHGMGAEHNSALLWTNLYGLLNDELVFAHQGQNIIMGITDYKNASDFDGTPIPLFTAYTKIDNPNIINDTGARSLVGNSGADYILGFAGDDRLVGRAGSDLLSGGDGQDKLIAGAGNDRLAGGADADTMRGGGGADQFHYGNVVDSTSGRGHDTILDFNIAQGDRLNFRMIDAQASVDGDQAFVFIHSDAFTAEGQIRAVQAGADTVLRLNTEGTGPGEMLIVLKNVDASTLTDDHFIL